MMEYKIVNHLEPDQWREFIDSHPAGNIFQTPEMFEVYSRTEGYKPDLWAIIDQGEILALHTPVSITLKGGVLHYLTTRNVSFGSVLAKENEAGKLALSTLLKSYNQNVSGASLFTELRNFSNLGYFQDILQENGYSYEGYWNYILDLNRNEYDILQSFSKSARQIIRAAIRKGELVVKEMQTLEMLPLFYELVEKTYKNSKVPLADISLFKAAFEVLVPKNMARFAICYANGVPAAATVDLHYKDVIYGWYNGMDRSLRNYNPNEFLMWDLIKFGVKNGYSVFDFGGGGKVNEESGVRDFKLKFRGNLIEYGRNTCVHAPLRMNLAENAYNTARKMLLTVKRILPNSSTKNFSIES